MSKSNSLFFCTPTPSMLYVRQKRVCHRAPVQCVCSYSHSYYLHAYKLCRCSRTTTGTQPIVKCSCVVFSGAMILSLYPRVRHACACHVYIHVRTYLPKFKNLMYYYYDTYRGTMETIFTVNSSYFGTKYNANVELVSC